MKPNDLHWNWRADKQFDKCISVSWICDVAEKLI